MNKKFTVWLLSPYHTGSHEYWANGLTKYSNHNIHLLTMAGRFWKWRMQGGAMELAAQARTMLNDSARPDLILATDMVNLAAWWGLIHAQGMGADLSDVPRLLYMHENQLTYPSRPGEKPDLTYPMINWLSQLCADRVIFNSGYHMESWFGAVPNLLKHFPDYNHLHLIDETRARSAVLPVGIDSLGEVACSLADRDAMSRKDPLVDSSSNSISQPSWYLRQDKADGPQEPMILWNQRWEYDKRPDLFFQTLYALQEQGTPFRLAVAGENFRNHPKEFDEACERLSERIVHWGYADSRAEYRALLQRADLVISTAEHEFFGISVLEAISAGAWPLLPNRLSYPELIPAQFHDSCLYEDEADLLRKANERLKNQPPALMDLRQHVHESFRWPHVAQQYDRLFESIVTG